jgi:sulfite exporter TauE/SafE
MINLVITAFIMGAIGSLHCIGMCGPIALALPSVNDDHASRFWSTFLYNGGRIITYTCLGGVFGALGYTFHFFGLQQLLSVTLGVLIILLVLFPRSYYVKENPLGNTLKKVRAHLGNLFKKKQYRSIFFIGLLNGLLPCGLVYIAIAGAIASASVVKSSLFMAAFGCGTLPLMWSLSFFGGFMNIKFRSRIRSAYPYFALVVAILLILRGLDLKIPYVSPSLNNDHQVERIECHDDKQVFN